MASTRVRALVLAVSLALGGTSGCSGEGVATSAEGRERSALAAGHVDVDTTAVVAVFLAVDGQRRFECTGTLLAPNVVLTAGHCVLAFDPDATTRAAACEGNSMPRLARAEDVTVVTGVHADENAYAVARLAVPAANGGRVTNLCGNDIALLVLKEPLPPGEAEPLALAVSEGVGAGESFDTVGFGAEDALAIPEDNVRRREGGSVRCVAPGCELDADVRAGEWLSEDTFACAGDSGGPALDQAGHVLGVVSRGFSDCHSIIYEEAYASRDFLERELSAAAAENAAAPTDGSADSRSSPVEAGCTLSVERRPGVPLLLASVLAGLLADASVRRLRRVRGGCRWR
jgi:hypothetical protein